MNSSKVYFPNLNALRFIAALMVIIHHIEQAKFYFKVESLWCVNAFVMLIGKLGVVLFFVLSGFLITYLLVKEEETHKTINIKKFYIRRILRIWPLYFFIVFLALFLLPYISQLYLDGKGLVTVHNSFFLKTLLFVFFLPNLVTPLLGPVPYAAQTWSIGTEEQFYLIWPLFIKHIRRWRKTILFVIIVLYNLIRLLLHVPIIHQSNIGNIMLGFWNNFSIDCMAIGSIFAIILFEKDKILSFIFNKTIFFIVFGLMIPFFHNQIYAIMFGLIIVNLAANKTLKISLENKILHYLGKISYGLYMYHPLCIVLSFKLLSYSHWYNSYSMAFFSIFTTIIISSLSYELFESRLIKIKEKFSVIISGENAKA